MAIGCCYAALAALCFYVYQKRAVFHPVADLAEVILIRQESDVREAGSLSGKVVKVTASDTLQIRTPDGLTYQIRLAGLDTPQEPNVHPYYRKNPSLAEAFAKSERTRTNLAQLVVSKDVRVELIVLTEQRSGLGIVYAGKTNINAALAEAGLAKVNRQYLKGLALGQQYSLVHGERKAKEKQRGLWAEGPQEIAMNKAQ